jgi:hypothetical protein
VSVGALVRDPMSSVDLERTRAFLRSPAAVAVAGLMVAAAVLRFARIGHQGFWFDEGNTALEVRYGVGQMLTLLKHYESTPPLYYAVAWVWARVFGYGETALRSLSAVCGVLVVPVAYAAARKLVSARAGLIAAALTAFNPLLIWYSQEARAYSLVVLLTGASLVAFAYARSDPAPRVLAAWALTCVLALATEYYAALLIVPEALWLLYVHRRHRPVYGAVGAIAVCSAPLLWFAISQNATGHAGWIALIPLGPRLGQIVPQFLVGFQAPARRLLERLAEVVAIVALVLLAFRSEPAERDGALLAGGLAIAGLLLNLLLIAGGLDDLITRNVISLWLPATVAVAGGLAARRARAVGVAGTVVLCAIGLLAGVGVAVDRKYQRPDWRAVARVLGTRPAAGGERAILIQHYKDRLPLSLYVPGLRFLRRGSATVSELDVIAISSPHEGLCWWGSACNLTPSQLQSSYPIPGFRELWVRRAYQFTIMRLVASAPTRIDGRIVAGALTATTLRRDEILTQR